jgi:hypothetical protein
VREEPNQPFQFAFHASLKLDFQGSRVPSDGGVILVPEGNTWLGLSEPIGQICPALAGRKPSCPSLTYCGSRCLKKRAQHPRSRPLGPSRNR